MIKTDNNVQVGYCSYELNKILKNYGFDFQGQSVRSYHGDNTPMPTHELALEWLRINYQFWVSITYGYQ